MAVSTVLLVARHRRGLTFIADVVETVVLAVLLYLGINALSARIRVDSVSMQPTLQAGDFVLVNRVAYLMGHPKRGDIIVFTPPAPEPPEPPYIKRIVGLPGEHVHIADGKIYIDGEELLETYLQVRTNQGGDWIVPADSLFVMGDNRQNSSDSRKWGFVTYKSIIGKAEVIYLPFNRWANLHSPSAVAAPNAEATVSP